MFARRVGEMEKYPRGYGVAYIDLLSRYAVCYPLPLNLVVALWHRAHQWLRYGHQWWRTGYDDGFAAGQSAAAQHVREMVRDHLERPR